MRRTCPPQVINAAELQQAAAMASPEEARAPAHCAHGCAPTVPASPARLPSPTRTPRGGLRGTNRKPAVARARPRSAAGGAGWWGEGACRGRAHEAWLGVDWIGRRRAAAARRRAAASTARRPLFGGTCVTRGACGAGWRTEPLARSTSLCKLTDDSVCVAIPTHHSSQVPIALAGIVQGHCERQEPERKQRKHFLPSRAETPIAAKHTEHDATRETPAQSFAQERELPGATAPRRHRTASKHG